MKGQRYTFAKQFVGEPTADNFQLEEYELDELKDGEILCEAVYLSVDPYQRAYMNNHPVGITCFGEQVAKVISSKNDKFPVGSFVLGYFGWQTRTVVNPGDSPAPGKFDKGRVELLREFDGDMPKSIALGALGMPGFTAYFGLLEICQPKAGETVVVTGAAGAVGSLVGQIAKLKGCNVVGFAGTDEKCELLKTEFGFDHAFNYKTADIEASLKAAAPKGVDCYFDNVGGEISSQILKQMNTFGRIAVCGAISSYNDVEASKATIVQYVVVMKQLKMHGFHVFEYTTRYPEAFADLLLWIREGKIKFRETVTAGFKNMPRAFIKMLRGQNIGKAIVSA